MPHRLIKIISRKTQSNIETTLQNVKLYLYFPFSPSIISNIFKNTTSFSIDSCFDNCIKLFICFFVKFLYPNFFATVLSIDLYLVFKFKILFRNCFSDLQINIIILTQLYKS